MGGAQTASQTDTESTGITLNVPSQSLVVSSAAYTFNPIVYITDAGTLKVAHGVDLTTGSSSGWYRQVYGHSYDMGLNLPNRFKSSVNIRGVEVWNDLNLDVSRMEMAGCYLRSNTMSAVSQTYDLLGEAIVAGTPVRLCARVYNLSLNQDITQPFDVKFESVLINTSDNSIIGDRQCIGTATVNPSLKARDWTEVYVVWTPVANKTEEAYRFYVIIDPEDHLPNEIHEWKETRQKYIGHEEWSDSDGRIYSGNNEGYWPWNAGVTVQDAASLEEPALPQDVHLKPDSLSVVVDGVVTNQNGIMLKKNTCYKLRAEVFFSGPSLRYTDVIFYDKNPEETDRAIANPIIMGNSGSKGYAWAQWTPKEAGSHTLYARLVEPHDDRNPGNHTASLQVTVMDTSAGGGGDSGGCFINALMP